MCRGCKIKENPSEFVSFKLTFKVQTAVVVVVVVVVAVVSIFDHFVDNVVALF